MDVSENSGTPKSLILIGFSHINHPFWGTLGLPLAQDTSHHQDYFIFFRRVGNPINLHLPLVLDGGG